MTEVKKGIVTVEGGIGDRSRVHNSAGFDKLNFKLWGSRTMTTKVRLRIRNENARRQTTGLL